MTNDYNLFDYLFWYRDLTFELFALNEVDLLILNVLLYLDFSSEFKSSSVGVSDISLRSLLNKYFINNEGKNVNLGLLIPSEYTQVAKMVLNSSRYEKIRCKGYVNKLKITDNEQFCAISYIINDYLYISFKGTDDSVMGWIENFCLVADNPTQAQIDSCHYTEKMANSSSFKSIILAGHSKGGNLAVYAALNSEKHIKDKISAVYSFDGPGVKNKGSDFESVGAKIHTVLPQESIIGRLFLKDDFGKKIIHSSKGGVNQHNPLFWNIERDRFKRCSTFTLQSNAINNALNNIIENMSQEDKDIFLSDIASFAKSSEMKRLSEFKDFYKLPTIILSLLGLSKQTKAYMLKVANILIRNNALSRIA